MTIKYLISFYPYRINKKYECKVSFEDVVYSDSVHPAIADTLEEAKSKALNIFENLYFQSSQEEADL